MSQQAVKKEVSVKQQNKDGLNTTNSSTEEKWQEIPLKKCTQEDLDETRYHIMKLQSKQDVDIVKNFTQPVRLHRKDPRNLQFHLTREELDKQKKGELTGSGEMDTGDDTNKTSNPEEIDLSQVAPDGGARRSKKNLFKRKTRQINLMDDEKRKLRFEEFYPWVVEDYDGKNAYVGSYEAGSSEIQQVLFVFDKGGFKMIPAEKTYRFTPRNKYATLTLEEAEAKMEQKSSIPRWLMKHMEDDAVSSSTADLRYRNNRKSPQVQPRNSGQFRSVIGEGNSNGWDSDQDEIDFDEEFDDDEEAPIMDGNEEENKLSEQKIKKEMLKAAHFETQSNADGDDDLDDLFESKDSRKVDKEGKKLRKVLHKTEGGVYDSGDDDEELNPYLSRSDLESPDESEEEITIKREDDDWLSHKPEKPRTAFSFNLGNGQIKITGLKDLLSQFPKSEWNQSATSRLPTAMPQKGKKEEKSPSKKLPSPPFAADLNSPGVNNELVTVSEVLDIIKNNEPLTPKGLLVLLKSRVSVHKDNKQRIIKIVKQNLKLSADDKLVLKEAS